MNGDSKNYCKVEPDKLSKIKTLVKNQLRRTTKSTDFYSPFLFFAMHRVNRIATYTYIGKIRANVREQDTETREQ